MNPSLATCPPTAAQPSAEPSAERSATTAPPHRVAFLGFSEFERGTLALYFRLAGAPAQRYEQARTLADADFLVADADHAPAVQLVAAVERMANTVFIGNQAPDGAAVWLARPIDALHVMHELDAMVAARDLALDNGPIAAAPQTRTPTPSPRAATPPPLQPRALVVDASEAARHVLQAQLQPWGLRVDCAGSSGQAIELMQRHS